MPSNAPATEDQVHVSTREHKSKGGSETTAGAEPKLYYSIREVSEMLDLEPYVLRFWEKEFPTLTPKKSNGGLRLYRQSDIDELRVIKGLLYTEKYTIEGARRQIAMGRRDGLQKLRRDNERLKAVVAEAASELRSLREKLN